MTNLTEKQMTLQEFLALPETNERIELIAGEMIVSPSSRYEHQRIVGSSHLLLRQIFTTGYVVLSPMDVIFDDGNVLQPDLFWVADDSPRCRLGADDYWYGAPDLVIEVLSPSTAFRDHGVKFRLYEQHGVREYWLIDAQAQFVEVFHNVNGQFVRAGAFGP